MTRRIDAVTGVRGLAAWLVVLYHIRASLTLPAPVITVLDRGYLAVDLFFVLSGFVLWLTWQRRFAEQGMAAARPFIAKRIARVWPLHAAILAATVAFALTIALSDRPVPEHYPWRELPLHVLLIQNWGFTKDIDWNYQSWSISTELAAYLAFALVLGLVRRSRAPGVAYPVAAVVILVVLLDRVFAWHGVATLGADVARLGLLRCLTEFALGVVGCALWQRASSGVVAAVGTVVLVTASLAWRAGARETAAVPLAFAALVPLLAATSSARGNPLSSRLAVWLGDISYSTYLVHSLLWVVFKLVFVRDIGDVSWMTIALFLALTLLASVALHRLVEVPGRRLETLLTRARRAERRQTAQPGSSSEADLVER